MEISKNEQNSTNFSENFSMNFSYRVYYEDTDAGGVVYYANYLRFFERARTDYLRKFGINQNQLAKEENLGFVVRNCFIQYLSPARLDDLLEVETTIKSIKSASISIQQKISIINNSINENSETSKKPCCALDVELVCIDFTGFKPKKIPENLKNRLHVR